MNLNVLYEDNVSLLKQKWLIEEPNLSSLGDLTVKSCAFLQSPYAHLSNEEKGKFITSIKKEYASIRKEYLLKKSPEIEEKNEQIIFKMIDDTMNYLLFLIDFSNNSEKDPDRFQGLDEHSQKEFKREAKIIEKVFGIRKIKDIMDNPDDACQCLEEMIQGATYKVLIPFDDIQTYYGKFHEAKENYDQKITRKISDREIHMYI